MNKTQHTQGPWRFDQSKGGAWFVYPAHKDQPLEPKVRVGKRGTKEQMANARLIASAPELLSALKAVQALLPDDVQTKVEALIDKAEGQ